MMFNLFACAKSYNEQLPTYATQKRHRWEAQRPLLSLPLGAGAGQLLPPR